MPKRSNQFQSLILLINNCIAGNSHVEESAMVPDKITGVLREIDILISTELSGYKVLIAIEVVGRGRKADTTWIESMYSKHNSLPTDKLILVSEKGFSIPALLKAKYLGIDAITIEKALVTNWEVAIQLAGQGFVEKTTIDYACAMIYQLADGTYKEIKIANYLEIKIGNKKNSVFEIVSDILNSENMENFVKEQISKSNNFEFHVFVPGQKPDGFFITEIDGQKAVAYELKIYVFIDHTKTPVEFLNGKYQNTDFVTGFSEPSAQKKLQLVIIKKDDGSTLTSIIDGDEIHKAIKPKGH